MLTTLSILGLLPCQKRAQRDQEGLQELLECCCVWTSVSDQIRGHVGTEGYKELEDMFNKGSLVIGFISWLDVV